VQGTPALATLGGEGALLLLRFAVDLPPDRQIVAAFILLERAMAVDGEPDALTLHAARVTEPWDSRSVTWALQPRLEESREVRTRVDPGSGALVRVEVRGIARGWLRRSPDEFGIAVESEGSHRSAMTFALVAGATSPRDEGARAVQGPRLELYVK